MNARSTTLPAAGTLHTISDVVALAKPRITFMVLCTTLGGLLLAPKAIDRLRATFALFAVALVVGGANALNMYLERDVDRLMDRTRLRPLPDGRLRPEVALIFGSVISLLGVSFLSIGINPLTGFLAAFSLVTYVLFYTPMKRRSTTALLVGAIPGAIPPLLGWTAAMGSVGPQGIALFSLLYFWQLPHFIAISIFLREDYARAGFKIVPVERGVKGAKQQIVLYSGALILVSIHTAQVGFGSALYFCTALLFGAGFLGLALYGLRPTAGDRWARGLFFFTLIYLPVLFAALVVGRA
jgi:protoheme IX farnesyltransferase